MNKRIITGRVLCLLLVICPCWLSAQNAGTSTYGFRHYQMRYQGDMVDILVKSKKGEEEKEKPLFLFCQGSLPVPLIITYDENGRKEIYNVFVFNPDSLLNTYHLAIIGKPYIPLVADQKELNHDLTYSDQAGNFPEQYMKRNLLDYYVDRNAAAIRFLRQQPWISKKQLVVAGHSEGSTIAAKLALVSPAVTALIYSGGNPMGRISTVIERSRRMETDSTKNAEDDIDTWKKVVADPENMVATSGDTYKATYQFSIPPFEYLMKLNIPVLVTYGSKDAGAPFNDYLQVAVIREKKNNFTFRAYVGTEHNYFPLNPDGSVNDHIFNWDKVAEDWWKWLKGNN